MAVKQVDLGLVVGKDAYTEAAKAGYADSEEQFYIDLAAIGDVRSVLDKLLNGTTT